MLDWTLAGSPMAAIIPAMRAILAVLLIILGAFAGLYAGLWWGFVGGIVQIIDGAKADPTSGVDIGIGLLRFWLAGPIGWIVAFFVWALALGIGHEPSTASLHRRIRKRQKKQ